MAISSCFCHPQFSLKMDCSISTVKSSYITRNQKQLTNFTLGSTNGQPFGQHFAWKEAKLSCGSSFSGRSKAIVSSNPRKLIHFRKYCRIYASWWSNPTTIANNVFTLGTVAVLPFYTLMLVAPKAELTQKSMESSIPYIVLGVLYACLLYLSWSPDTLRLMFASKYWLPELPGIAKMFSNEITLASAWLHLLAIDLYAARQVYKDGIKNNIETRHSVSICLLFCPIGIIVHYITKYLTISSRNTKQEIH